MRAECRRGELTHCGDSIVGTSSFEVGSGARLTRQPVLALTEMFVHFLALPSCAR